MRSGLKISISSVLTVLIFVTQFISLKYISWYNLLRYGTIVVIGLYICTRIKYNLKNKYLLINVCALIFALLTVCTSYLNRNRTVDRNPFLASIPFVASFIFFLLFMEIMIEQKKVKKTIRIFFRTALLFATVTDILIFTFPSLFATFNVYLVGTKFDVVYEHLLLVVLYLAQINLNKKKDLEIISLLFLILWSFFIGIYVECSTGIVGVFILLALLFIARSREKLFFNGLFYCCTQFFCFGFVFFYEVVLSNQTVKNLITNVLKKDITLTTRTYIFEKVPVILTTHNGWIQGLGYGTSYDLGMKYGGFPDTQNGILEWIWQVGIPTTVIMVLMFAIILTVSGKCLNNNNKRILLSLISGLYLFTILGTVEITISSMYFSIVVCIMSVAISTHDSEENVLDTYYDTSP